MILVLTAAVGSGQYVATVFNQGRGPVTLVSSTTFTGSNCFFNGASSGTCKPTQSVSANHRLAVLVISNTSMASGVENVSVTDPNNDTFACFNVFNSGANQALALCNAILGVGITTSTSITTHFADGNNGACSMLFDITTSGTTNASDSTGTAQTNSAATITATTGSLSTNDYALFAAVWGNAHSFTSLNNGLTQITNLTTNFCNSYGLELSTGWKTASSGGTTSGGITINGSGDITGLIGAYKQ